MVDNNRVNFTTKMARRSTKRFGTNAKRQSVTFTRASPHEWQPSLSLHLSRRANPTRNAPPVNFTLAKRRTFNLMVPHNDNRAVVASPCR
jgi:hypothetical protein